jgi:hypothetical protein
MPDSFKVRSVVSSWWRRVIAASEAGSARDMGAVCRCERRSRPGRG